MTNTATLTSCSRCNGDLVFNPSAQTLDCEFCSSSFTLAGQLISGDTAFTEMPKRIIPFTFAKKVFESKTPSYLYLDKYTPLDFIDYYDLKRTKGRYVPIYKWDISYSIASPAGNKNGTCTCYDSEDGVLGMDIMERMNQNDPSIEYNEQYTLGFEKVHGYAEAGKDPLTEGKAFAMNWVKGYESQADIKNITITGLEMTTVYVPFWYNEYEYKGKKYDVNMLGFDSSQIFDYTPQKTEGMDEEMPGYKIVWGMIVAWLVLICIALLLNHKVSDHIVTPIVEIWLSLYLIIPGTAIFIRMRRSKWVAPEQKMHQQKIKKLNEKYPGWDADQ